MTKLIPVPLRQADLRGLFHLVCSSQGLLVQMISLVFHSCESRLSFEMLHASTERRILCKRNFMQRGDGMECLVRQLVGVAVYHELRLCLGKLGLANLLHTSASQCGRGLPYI